jgi:hypothetical protein
MLRESPTSQTEEAFLDAKLKESLQVNHVEADADRLVWMEREAVNEREAKFFLTATGFLAP